MENQSVKMFSLPRDVIALSGVASKNTSRAPLNAVHFDGKNAMATDGHRLALVPFDNQELKGMSLDLRAVKKPKSAYMTFTRTGETLFLSEVGPAGVVEGTAPNYKQVIPTVSRETHQAIAINVDYLLELYKAIDSDNKGDKKGILTLLVSKQSNLDAIGVVSSNSAGIGVLMPCRPFGGAGFPGAFEKFNAISGQNSLEGQIKAVDELIRKVEAGEVELSSDVAAVFNQPGEVADAFKVAAPVVEEEAEQVDPYSWEADSMEEETELVEEEDLEDTVIFFRDCEEEITPAEEREVRNKYAAAELASQPRTIRAGYPLQGDEAQVA